MNLNGLVESFTRTAAFCSLVGEGSEAPLALLQAARPLVAAGLRQVKGGPVVLLTARGEMAQQLCEQLALWLPPVEQGGPPVLRYAEPDALPYERIHWSHQARQQRLTALAALQSREGPPPVVVASVRALMQKTLPPRELRMALRPIKVGEVVRLEQMIERWVQSGYNPEDVVEEPGRFARRGGIIDIWPPNLVAPVRIDLFGDEVESLRLFDPATQRTIGQVQSIAIGPGSEALAKYGQAALARLGLKAEQLLSADNIGSGVAGSPLNDPNLLLAVREELRLEVEHLVAGQSFHGIEWYLPYFYEQPASLLDYLGPDATLLLDDSLDFFATLYELETQANGLAAELRRTGELPAGFAPSFFTTDEMRGKLVQAKPLILGLGDIYGKSTDSNTPLARLFVPGPRYGGKTKQIVSDIAKLNQSGHAVVLATRQASRMLGLLQEGDLPTQVQSELVRPPLPGSRLVVQGILGEGFVMRGISKAAGRSDDTASGEMDVHLLTDTELFGWSKPQARRRPAGQSKVAAEIFFADVKAGDYVVHLEHGVGLYDGLVQIDLSGVTREYLQVSYARNDKLYVPVHQADRLSRYVGAGEKTPSVNRLGTADWQMVKDRARKAVAEIADDLLKLYAERELVRGHAFSPDGPWQDELAASFPYEETDDQLHAIDAVRRDMESDQPMDRLVCGDVGYGKTEVAVRAAFKAITDGKQVAFLVPTTVLALQHYRTLSERLSRFPVRVEMLSRFRTPAQQETILRGLAAGTIDMVVGTHRVLSNDLDFKDLGLLIIDEEQRFGVQQKEKLKQLRTQVDVLTLSATPIPRTLHMSLSGIRDMSAINTPPKERLPVHTVLAEYDDVMVRQAIERELSRNGQVFVVTDKVRGIQALADRIRHLVPEARVDIGHGQVSERELEDVMARFAQGEVDILVATTIIENGLDIPNANTIIINRADHFGLAQLYQLRGRVGRSAQRGHCYLLYEKHKPLSYDARRRLSAIMESSEELGAGFRIAMRDLEIRGAGDLLGARQHGHIDSVGFDLYTRLLAQAINESKRKKQLFDRALKLHEDVEGAVDSVSTVPSGAGLNGGAPQESTPMSSATSETEAFPETPFDLADPLAPPVQLDLPLDAQIPQTYVEEEGLRLQMYRRIAGMTHLESIDEMRKELVDRFGVDELTQSVPDEVENLLYQIRVKILALRAGVQNIGRELDQLVLRSDVLENIDRRSLARRLQQGFGHPDDPYDTDAAVPRVARRAVYLPIDDEGKWQAALIRTLELLAYS